MRRKITSQVQESMNTKIMLEKKRKVLICIAVPNLKSQKTLPLLDLILFQILSRGKDFQLGKKEKKRKTISQDQANTSTKNM